MKSLIISLTAAALCGTAVYPSAASDRYRQRPPVVVSQDVSGSWLMQLGKNKRKKQMQRLRRADTPGIEVQPARRMERNGAPTGIFTLFVPDVAEEQPRATRRTETRRASLLAPRRKEVRTEIDPMYLPQQVDYDGQGAPGTIVIDSAGKFLYLVQSGGKARRYGVGVGKEGFGWTGTQTITQKKVWPEWRPPAEMIAREREVGRVLPAHMDGGPANPLGARALYLGDTLYRIHGTNAPWTIGTNVSSGCIRLRNEDVSDLYDRVDVGTKVIVM